MSDELIFDAPLNVIELILSYLPVIILMRYRCVSKSFRDLIDSRYFTNMHLHHSITTRSNRNILCVRTRTNRNLLGSSDGLHFINVDTLHYFAPTSPRFWNSSTQYIGTCNGVVLLYDDGIKEITLWNPAIRTYIHVIVPCVSSIPDQGSNKNYKYNFGFGYDKVNDDYKVVMSVQLDYSALFKGVKIVKEVHVYSLKTNSWRRIGDFPYSVCDNKCPATYANGALYWVCVEETVDPDDSLNFIVAFDLAREEYRIIELPPVSNNLSYVLGTEIGSVEGVLWMLCYVYESDSGNEDELVEGTCSVQQRDEEEDTWTPLVFFNRSVDFRRPLVYSKCGKRLLLANCVNFLWIDLVKNEEAELKIWGLPHHYDSDVCFESLVHLDAGTTNAENQQIREKKVV